jgi:hypothetical protein
MDVDLVVAVPGHVLALPSNNAVALHEVITVVVPEAVIMIVVMTTEKVDIKSVCILQKCILLKEIKLKV